MDNPETFLFNTSHGTVAAVHPDTWEVDILAADGGVVNNALVLGPRLPEASLPSRPQWVIYGFADNQRGQAWCIPVPSRLFERVRGQYAYWDEVLHWRITINRNNELEILHPSGQFHILLQETDGVIRVEVPEARVVLKNSDKTLLVECTERLTVHCKDATVNVENDADVTVGGNVSAQVAGRLDAIVGVEATIEAPQVTVESPDVLLGENGVRLPVMLDTVIAKFNLHTHGGVDSGSGTSGPPNAGQLAPSDATVNVKAK